MMVDGEPWMSPEGTLRATEITCPTSFDYDSDPGRYVSGCGSAGPTRAGY